MGRNLPAFFLDCLGDTMPVNCIYVSNHDFGPERNPNHAIDGGPRIPLGKRRKVHLPIFRKGFRGFSPDATGAA